VQQQSFSRQAMPELGGVIHKFTLQIFETYATVDYGWIDRNDQILINRHSENQNAVLFVEGG
jgi:hypothetical protein